MILNEMNHDARIVRHDNSKHLPSVRPWMGDSIGWWEGDTLVVETTNFTGKDRFRGSTENLKVAERFSRLDAKTLLYRFTVEDPRPGRRPWTASTPGRPRPADVRVRVSRGNYALGEHPEGRPAARSERREARGSKAENTAGE